MNFSQIVLVTLVASHFCADTSLAQSTYPQALLNQKGTFSRQGAEAMGEEFQGLRTSD